MSSDDALQCKCAARSDFSARSRCLCGRLGVLVRSVPRVLSLDAGDENACEGQGLTVIAVNLDRICADAERFVLKFHADPFTKVKRSADPKRSGICALLGSLLAY